MEQVILFVVEKRGVREMRHLEFALAVLTSAEVKVVTHVEKILGGTQVAAVFFCREKIDGLPSDFLETNGIANLCGAPLHIICKVPPEEEVRFPYTSILVNPDNDSICCAVRASFNYQTEESVQRSCDTSSRHLQRIQNIL